MSSKNTTTKRGVSRASKISYKSAATVRKRRNYIENLSPARQQVAMEFLNGKTVDQVSKKFSKSLVSSLVKDINSKGIYFRQLRSTSKRSK